MLIGGFNTEVTLTVGCPVCPVERYSSCTVLTGSGRPAMWAKRVRVLSTVPGATLASGVLPV